MGFARIGLVLGLGVLVGCTPPTPKMTVEEAMAACRADIANPVKTNAGVGVSIGSGGKVRPSANLSIGVDVSALSNPEKAYENCVKRNSGQAPTESL